MNRRIFVFLIIEVLLIVCLGLAAFTEVYYLTFLILLLTPAALMIMLLNSNHKKGSKGSRVIFFSIIFYYYIQLNVSVIIDDDYIWKGPFRFPDMIESDGGVFALMIIVSVSILVAFIAIYELIVMYERNNKKRIINEMDEK